MIKQIVFLRNQDLNGGPAKVGMRGNILIDVKYLENEQPGFDDNRLIVVLYHEIGTCITSQLYRLYNGIS